MVEMSNRRLILLSVAEKYLERATRNYKRLSHSIQLPRIKESCCKITDIDPRLAFHMVKPVSFVHPLELYRVVPFKTLDSVGSYSPCPKALDERGHIQALHGFFKFLMICVTFQIYPPPLRLDLQLQVGID